MVRARFGIIVGEPKCCKTFLALGLAVAAGTPSLRRLAVAHARPGRVLLYPGEDPLHVVRRRLEGIYAAAGTGLAALDVQVITTPSLRLDLKADCARLEETAATVKPRLLLFDPCGDPQNATALHHLEHFPIPVPKHPMANGNRNREVHQVPRSQAHRKA